MATYEDLITLAPPLSFALPQCVADPSGPAVHKETRRSSIDRNYTESMIPDGHLVQTTAYGGHLEAPAKGEVLDVTDRVFPGIKGGGSHDGSVASEEGFRIWSSSSDEQSSCMMSTLSIEDRSMPEEGSPKEKRTMNESWQQRLPCSPDAHATGEHVSQVADPAQASAVGSELAVARGKLNQKDVIIRSLRRQLDEQAKMEIRLGANAQEDLAAALARTEGAEKELAAISDLLTSETYARRQLQEQCASLVREVEDKGREVRELGEELGDARAEIRKLFDLNEAKRSTTEEAERAYAEELDRVVESSRHREAELGREIDELRVSLAEEREVGRKLTRELAGLREAACVSRQQQTPADGLNAQDQLEGSASLARSPESTVSASSLGGDREATTAFVEHDPSSKMVMAERVRARREAKKRRLGEVKTVIEQELRIEFERLRHAVEIQHGPEQPNAPCPRCRRTSGGDRFPGLSYGSSRTVEDESPDSGKIYVGSPTAPALHTGRPAEDETTAVADHGDAVVVGRRTMRKHLTEAARARDFEAQAGAAASTSSADAATERALLPIEEVAAQTRCPDWERRRALSLTPLEEDRLSCRWGQGMIALSLEPNQEVQLLREALQRAQQEMGALERSVMEGRSKVAELEEQRLLFESQVQDLNSYTMSMVDEFGGTSSDVSGERVL